MTIAPAFVLRLGAYSADSGQPASGPTWLQVDRSLDVPADGLRALMAGRHDVEPGDKAELDLGHGDQLERVFTGTVVEVRPSSEGAEVFAVGTMLDLIELRVAAHYAEQSAGDIARDLIGLARLEEGDISNGVTLPRFAVEPRRSAFAQLKALARRHGFDLFSDKEGSIHFRGLGAAGSLDAGPAGSLVGAAASSVAGDGAEAYGKHLIDVRAVRRRDPARTLVVGGESPMSGGGEDKSFWLTAKDADYQDSAGAGQELLIVDPTARTKDMAGRFAAGYLSQLQRSRRAVTVTLLGRPGLDLGSAMAAEDGPDELMNAAGVVTSVRHSFGGGVGFLTRATILVEEET